MRFKDLGSAFNVSVSGREIDEFNQGHPASELRGLRGVTFQFDKRNGDLVDIWPPRNRKRDINPRDY